METNGINGMNEIDVTNEDSPNLVEYKTDQVKRGNTLVLKCTKAVNIETLEGYADIIARRLNKVPRVIVVPNYISLEVIDIKE